MSAHSAMTLPEPRALRWLGGVARIPRQPPISVDAPEPGALRVACRWLAQAIERAAAAAPEHDPGGERAVRLTVAPAATRATRHSQGYELTVDDRGIQVRASTPAGAHYGAVTVAQLIDTYGADVPRLHVEDWPALPSRGVLLDVSRGRVPTIETLFGLVDRLAGWKYNQLQLYTEHTFAYAQHPDVWAGASPMTADDIRALDEYCSDRFVELVPNQQSFGHMRRWLELPAYRHLAEAPNGFVTPFGRVDGPFSLCPTDPRSVEFLRGLYDELLPNFSSRQFNVNADETDDIGQGRSRRAVEDRGVGRVYLEFVTAIHREVSERGRTMQYWGDIVLRHPELASELPHDATVLDWGYEAGHEFGVRTRPIADAGIPFYVCPGTSSWQSITGRSGNAIANVGAAASLGEEHGAAGFLICDWGDDGHWQPPAVSLLPWAYGAAVSWNPTGARAARTLASAMQHAFEGSAEMGDVAYELGQAYAMSGADIPATSPLFLLLLGAPAVSVALLRGRVPPPGAESRILVTPTVVRELAKVDRAHLEATMSHVQAQVRRLRSLDLPTAEGARVKAEYEWASDMLLHACRRALWLEGLARGREDATLRRALAQEAVPLAERFAETWCMRDREGGLDASLALLRRTFGDYSER